MDSTEFRKTHHRCDGYRECAYWAQYHLTRPLEDALGERCPHLWGETEAWVCANCWPLFQADGWQIIPKETPHV